MTYDFETCYDRRHDGSAKWMAMYDAKGEPDLSAVPLSVADMEFKTPPAIVAALQDLLENHALGYLLPTDEYYEAVLSWQRKRHSWEAKKEWLCLSSGIVPALHIAVSIFTKEGDGVIIQPPVYYPFMSAVESTGRVRVNNPLRRSVTETGELRYEIDFDDLEVKAQNPANKLLILCSPHNPVGRVWTAEELRRLVDICMKNEVFIVSDEIHNDLIMPGQKHTTIASVTSEDELERCMVCTAPSKSFNIPGLQCSNIFIPGEHARELYQQHQASRGFFALNAAAYTACISAYTSCEDWLDQLLERVWDNRCLVAKYLEEHAPELVLAPLEGTFLLWIDFRAWKLSDESLEALMHRYDLFFDEGYIFGDEGSGFERINLACPQSTIEWMLEHLSQARAELEIGE